ncbi:MAG: hypothetical protein ABL984_08730 [Pyrinomonadaceae bacterium]
MATEESTLELLARLGTEVLMEELTRRAVVAGMGVEDFIRETRENIRTGRDENTAGLAEGHEGESLATD